MDLIQYENRHLHPQGALEMRLASEDVVLNAGVGWVFQEVNRDLFRR